LLITSRLIPKFILVPNERTGRSGHPRCRLTAKFVYVAPTELLLERRSAFVFVSHSLDQLVKL